MHWHMTRGGPQAGRRGVVTAMAVVGMVAMLGVVGFAVDIGLLSIAAQQCQDIADAGALAGCQEMPIPTSAEAAARSAAAANIPATDSTDYTVQTAYYLKDQTLPDGTVAPFGGALEVTAHKWVTYHFLRVLGYEGITVTRSAMSTKVITGTCIAPMWIWDTTPVSYGVSVNLLMADAPNCGIPGSFGFLEPGGGVDFDACLKGIITPEQEEAQRLVTGDTVWARTGLGVGHWRGDLETDYDSRLKRASRAPYSADTFTNFHADNPRILIVPFCHYLGGTGSGAHFKVIKFGAFWLQNVVTNGSDRYINGRFLDYTKPGGTGSGIKTTHLTG